MDFICISSISFAKSYNFFNSTSDRFDLINDLDNSTKISKIRSSLESEKQISLALFDIIYMFEKILQSWSDITDLVKPSYQ